eukprot:Nitzschia sp. Nitz4//scaffold290_size23356//10574//11555//NITZ4_008489-RA/size23356-processed-gene-0.27-mRNA-1//-1//CDS//3329546096//8870//frame0
MDARPSLYVFDLLTTQQQRDSFFRGKTVWITGASSGIGANLALKLSRSGANLILSSRESDNLQSVLLSCCKEAQEHGTSSNIVAVPLDLAAPNKHLREAVNNVVKACNEETLDIIVFNAGKGQLLPASMTPLSVSEQLFKVNTLATISLTQILMDKGVIGPDGTTHVVVTSSIAAKMGVPLSSSYAASKHALHGYFNSLMAELPWLHIDLICPSTVDTEFHNSHIGGSGIHILESGETSPRKHSPLKMSVDRCVDLYISSVMMKSKREQWIACQPAISEYQRGRKGWICMTRQPGEDSNAGSQW